MIKSKPIKASKSKKTDGCAITAPDPFLLDILQASSPSGYEFEAQQVIEKYVKPFAQSLKKDALGNRIATINPKGSPHVLLSGHMDELGFIIRSVSKEGFLFFDTIGGHDVGLISGRKVRILTAQGFVYGVIGKRAVHLLTAEERKQVPKVHTLWIDIGAKDKEDALKKVSIGDAAVYDNEPFMLANGLLCARGIDDRGGTYVVQEVLRRLSKEKIAAALTSVSSTQEELGSRGALPAAYGVHPHLGIAVDVAHATDFPDGESSKWGEFKLGGGPILTRGPNICPTVFEHLQACAKRLKIPYQVEAEGGPTGTDARVIQTTQAGIASGLVSIPLRYMHTPHEVVCLQDIEWVVQLLGEAIRTLKPNTTFDW